MVDAGMKNSSSGEADEDANGEEEVNPPDVQKDAVDSEEGSSEDERDLDPDSAEKGSLSDSSEDEQVDPPKESSYDSLGEEQVDNAVDVQSKKTLLDSDLSSLLDEPFQPRRSSRNAAKKNTLSLKLFTSKPPKPSIKRKPALKSFPILPLASV